MATSEKKIESHDVAVGPHPVFWTHRNSQVMYSAGRRTVRVPGFYDIDKQAKARARFVELPELPCGTVLWRPPSPRPSPYWRPPSPRPSPYAVEPEYVPGPAPVTGEPSEFYEKIDVRGYHVPTYVQRELDRQKEVFLYEPNPNVQRDAGGNEIYTDDSSDEEPSSAPPTDLLHMFPPGHIVHELAKGEQRTTPTSNATCAYPPNIRQAAEAWDAKKRSSKCMDAMFTQFRKIPELEGFVRQYANDWALFKSLGWVRGRDGRRCELTLDRIRHRFFKEWSHCIGCECHIGSFAGSSGDQLASLLVYLRDADDTTRRSFHDKCFAIDVAACGIRMRTTDTPDGKRYIGQVNEDNIPHLRGIMTTADGTLEYVGDWRNGKRHGEGVRRYANGETPLVSLVTVVVATYDGSWMDDKRHGRGVMRYADGSQYDGSWKDDKMHGEGVMKYADGTITNGSWKDGNLHDGVVNKNRTSSENTAQGRVVALSASNGTAQGGSKNNGGGIRQQAPPTQHALALALRRRWRATMATVTSEPTAIQLLTLKKLIKKLISEYKQLHLDLDINFIRKEAARAMAQVRAAGAQLAATSSAAPAAAAPLLGSKRKRDTEDCVTTETVSPIDALRRRMNPENTVDLTT
jgi:hypothetical protein